jgi:hypothetical protein
VLQGGLCIGDEKAHTMHTDHVIAQNMQESTRLRAEVSVRRDVTLRSPAVRCAPPWLPATLALRLPCCHPVSLILHLPMHLCTAPSFIMPSGINSINMISTDESVAKRSCTIHCSILLIDICLYGLYAMMEADDLCGDSSSFPFSTVWGQWSMHVWFGIHLRLRI